MLSHIKWSRTEEQRQDYHVILTALAPRRSSDGSDADDMIERVATELGVTPGKRCAARRTADRAPLCMHAYLPPHRYHKPSGQHRARAFEQCVSRRAVVDAHLARFPLNAKGLETAPFCVGDAVLCRAQPGVLDSFASGAFSSAINGEPGPGGQSGGGNRFLAAAAAAAAAPVRGAGTVS